MGPRHFSRGKPTNDPTQLLPMWIGFNGATAFQPWKAELTDGSSHIPPLLQWGHGISAVESLLVVLINHFLYGGFNGATAFQPWKARTPFSTS